MSENVELDKHQLHEEKRKVRARRAMKLSVIFGVRNRAQYAKKVLRSLLIQDIARDLYEVVVVDFSSQDDIKSYIDLIKAENIKYVSIPNAKQYDRARAFNIGTKHAQHHLLIFTEADLLFPKYALRLIRDHAVNNENQIIMVKQKNLEKLETAMVLGKTYSDYGEMLSKININERIGVDACCVIERPQFEELGGFDEDYSGESYEVRDFVERVKKEKVVQHDLPDVFLLHMWHNEFQKDNEGYYWELYSRKSQIATSVRNQNKDWGVIVPRRPTVLFMLSPSVWEAGSICKHVGEFLFPYYQVDMCGARDELRGKTLRKYDIVFTIDWRLPKEVKNECRLAAGVFDYISWNDGITHNVMTELVQSRLQLFDAIATPCRDLREIVASYHANTMYVPVAVDTEMFKPLKYKRRVSDKFTVGWVGKAENEHTIEGYLEHVKPICNSLPGVDLFTAPGGEDINGPTQMLGFYNAIDVLVNFNETAGDCKSILEAMACGIPVITTKVGDIEEIIESYANGIVIARNEEALKDALLRLKTQPEHRLRMGQLARETIVKRYDWRDKAVFWRQFFDTMMEM